MAKNRVKEKQNKSEKKKNKSRSFIVKFIITILIFTFIFMKIDFHKILSIIKNINLFILFLSAPFLFLFYGIKTTKWNLLLRALDEKTDFIKNYVIIIISTFYCLVTPGKAGELTRALYLKADKAKIVSTVIWDKIIDVFVLIVLSDILVFTLFRNIILQFLMLIISFGFIVFVFILFNEKITHFVLKLIKIKEDTISNYIINLNKIKKNKKIVIKNTIYTFLFYTVGFIITYFVLISLQKNASYIFSLSYPLFALLGNIPITLSGLGTREYVNMVCFETLGSSPDLGFTVSFVFFIISVLIPGILGGILSLKAKIRIK